MNFATLRKHRRKVGIAAMLGLLLSGGTAWANRPTAVLPPPPLLLAPPQPETPPLRDAPQIDPANLTIARQIAAIALPPEKAAAMFRATANAMSGPMLAQLRQIGSTSDPGMAALVNEFADKLPSQVADVMTAHLPDMSEAMARAYARKFSRDDLEHILAFARTPAGTNYLSKASQIMQDPDIQSFFASIFRAMQADQDPLVAEFERKVAAYRAAHPATARPQAKPSAK